MALKLGYFAEAGLDVEPRVPSDPSAPIKQVAAGRSDLAISYEPEVLLARDQGLDGDRRRRDRPAAADLADLASRLRHHRAADLGGKTVATAGIPYQDAFLKTILARSGQSTDDVKSVDGRPQPPPRPALGAGRRDPRRLRQCRGRRPGAARQGPDGRAGRPARRPHLRRARAGRQL